MQNIKMLFIYVDLCPFYFLLTLSGFMWFAPFACLWIFVDTSGCLRNQRDQTCWHHCRWNSEMSLAVMVPKRSWWKWWISWKTPPGLRHPSAIIIIRGQRNKQCDLPTVDVILLNMLMSSCYVLLMLEFPSLLTYGGWFWFCLSLATLFFDTALAYLAKQHNSWLLFKCVHPWSEGKPSCLTLLDPPCEPLWEAVLNRWQVFRAWRKDPKGSATGWSSRSEFGLLKNAHYFEGFEAGSNSNSWKRLKRSMQKPLYLKGLANHIAKNHVEHCRTI